MPKGGPARRDDLAMRGFGPGANRGADERDDGTEIAPPPKPRRATVLQGRDEEEEEAFERPPRRGFGRTLYIWCAVAVLLLAAVGATVWKWQVIVETVQGFASPFKVTKQEQPASPAVPQNRTQKDDSRLGSGTAPPAPNTQAVAEVAQRVVLYEEDPADPAGKKYVGSSVWRTESVPAGPNQPPETVIRADIEIPERKMAMKWSLRRNSDKTLPASHTVEIMFTLPADFPHGSVQNIPGMLMKQEETTRGVPLAGLAVKVTNGFFLIGLSAVEADMQRNIQLLKERTWFDVPIVYTDGRRAILAVEKGNPGERAFNSAFATWKQ